MPERECGPRHASLRVRRRDLLVLRDGSPSKRPTGAFGSALRRTGAYPTHVVFEPLVLLERLAALVPLPREHLLTSHGVLAPASSWCDLVVPAAARENESETAEPACAARLDSHEPDAAAEGLSASVGADLAHVGGCLAPSSCL